LPFAVYSGAQEYKSQIKPKKKIAYVKEIDGNYEIQIENIDSKYPQRITYTKEDESNVRWLEENLLFLRKNNLYMLKPDGKETIIQDQVQSFDVNDSQTQLVYARQDSMHLAIIDQNDILRNLTSTHTYEYQGSYVFRSETRIYIKKKDGSWIVFNFLERTQKKVDERLWPTLEDIVKTEKHISRKQIPRYSIVPQK